ncbi:flagellar motor stator protein MotA [Hankyongella ginsenosidimutans]|uniref:Flagellar motor stator protein MotA n=1 Tax=Hankyongella ginsenosidimutans TaxID=1763828 RepID=A0A4D7C6A3_9SPHN|nr:flagellar motor stator protein MotA [Hankyongella ginsenosidimutans]QCI79320.1 flagellar motor stator protein MotA [Hankyongella ginsenosidimutans]
MFIIIGLAVVMGCVFGSYVISGGKFEIIMHALPHEMMAIAGAAVGAFIVANSMGILAGGGLGRAFKGESWKKQDFADLLCLMFILMKTIRAKGVVAIEGHIERPEESKIFQNFPKIAKDHHLLDFICDYLRMMTMNFEDPHQVESAMEQDIEKHHKEEHAIQHSLVNMSEGLPAIGIVAAVLGVIKTMGSIDQPTEVLGALIGGALTGTFLGVLLSYCVVGPIANRLGQVMEADSKPFDLVKIMLVAHLQAGAAGLGRSRPPQHAHRHGPTFAELEEAINGLPNDLA